MRYRRDWQPELVAEPRFTNRTPSPASVLVPIVLREQPMVLLTQRTIHLSTHSGQIAFPGGKQDAEDADLTMTALREAQEEIGLQPEFVQVLGTLPIYRTGSAFIITPVVAMLRDGFTVERNADEVDEIFEVPLAFLMNPANHRRHAVDWDGGRREWLSMPYQDGSQRALYLGRDGRHAAQLLPFSVRLTSWSASQALLATALPDVQSSTYHSGMSFVAILIALLLEQARPVAYGNAIHMGAQAGSTGAGAISTPGSRTMRGSHGASRCWFLRCLACWCIGCWPVLAGWPFAVLWSIVVLYLTLGFRQFSHHFTEIRDALEAGDEVRARQLLAHWRRVDANGLPTQRDRAPGGRALGHFRAPPCVWGAGVVLGPGGARDGAGGRRRLPHERVRAALLDAPQCCDKWFGRSVARCRT